MKRKELDCPKCGKAKRQNGSYCHACNSQYMKDYRKKMKEDNPDKYKKIQWTDNLKKNYGISIEDYQKMFKDQNGRCLICNGLPNGTGKKNSRLFIDHCHKTGDIRGLLCHHCNAGLGAFKHNPELLLRAIEYLKENLIGTLAG